MSKSVLCTCEDVTLDDVRHAIDKGYRDIESIKRYTGFGTGFCQGKTCLSAVARTLAERTGATPGRGAPLHSAAAAAPGRAVAPRLGAGRRVACRHRRRAAGDPGRLARAPSHRARPREDPGGHRRRRHHGPGPGPQPGQARLHRGHRARARLPLRRRQRPQRRRGADAVGHRGQHRARPAQHRPHEAVRRRDGHQRLAPAGRLPVPRPDRGGRRAAPGQRRAAQQATG